MADDLERCENCGHQHGYREVCIEPTCVCLEGAPTEDQCRRINKELDRIAGLEAKLAATERERDQARKESESHQEVFEADLAGNAGLRWELGARPEEGFPDFVRRLATERDEARDALEKAEGRPKSDACADCRAIENELDELRAKLGKSNKFVEELMDQRGELINKLRTVRKDRKCWRKVALKLAGRNHEQKQRRQA